MPIDNGGTPAPAGPPAPQGDGGTPPAAGPTSSSDTGEPSASAGMDTPLDPSVHGGKYKTVGDLSKATSELHNQLGTKTDPNNPGGDDSKPAPATEPPRALTHEDLDIRDKQNLEQKNFDDSAKQLGLTGPQKKALATFGELEENAEKGWADLALEIGFTTEDKVAQARGMTHDERGGGGVIGGSKDPSTATTAKQAGDIIDTMSDDEFDAHVDKMAAASKTGNLR